MGETRGPEIRSRGKHHFFIEKTTAKSSRSVETYPNYHSNSVLVYLVTLSTSYKSRRCTILPPSQSDVWEIVHGSGLYTEHDEWPTHGVFGRTWAQLRICNFFSNFSVT